MQSVHVLRAVCGTWNVDRINPLIISVDCSTKNRIEGDTNKIEIDVTKSIFWLDVCKIQISCKCIDAHVILDNVHFR